MRYELCHSSLIQLFNFLVPSELHPSSDNMAEFTIEDKDLTALKGKVVIITGTYELK